MYTNYKLKFKSIYKNLIKTMKIVLERGNLMKKFLNIFLVFAMIFSMIFQYSGRASAAEYPNNVITGANITDL